MLTFLSVLADAAMAPEISDPYVLWLLLPPVICPVIAGIVALIVVITTENTPPQNTARRDERATQNENDPR